MSDTVKGTALGDLLDKYSESELLGIDQDVLLQFEESAQKFSMMTLGLSHDITWKTIKTILASAYLLGREE